MLKFDSKTMTRAVFAHPFILSDSNYGIVSVDEDDNIAQLSELDGDQ